MTARSMRRTPSSATSMRIAKRFDSIDTDHDGKISKAEFAAAEERRGEDGPRRFGPGRFGQGGPGRAMLFHRAGPDGGRFRGPLPFAPPPGEGRRFGGPDRKPGAPLTKADFVSRGLARFDAIDTDHDGKISPAEREASRPRHGRRFGGRPRTPPPPSSAPQSEK